jgi:hypothetical protein
MKGWMRQKYVYVPGFRFEGVFHVVAPAAGIWTPSVFESNGTLASASGKAMPVLPVQGARQDVIEWNSSLPASRFVNVTDWPRGITGGSLADPARLRSPTAYLKSTMSMLPPPSVGPSGSLRGSGRFDLPPPWLRFS